MAQPRKSGCLRLGCVVALLLLGVTCGWSWWRITLPGRLAAATHAQIRPGATLQDVFAVADRYWMVKGSDCPEGVESFQVFTPGLAPAGHLTIRRAGSKSPDGEELRFDSKPELLGLIDAQPQLSKCRKLSFTFRVSGVPPKVSFTVELGEDGRVVRVSAPRTWD